MNSETVRAGRETKTLQIEEQKLSQNLQEEEIIIIIYDDYIMIYDK